MTDYDCLACHEIQRAKKIVAESIETKFYGLTFTAMDLPFLPLIPAHIKTLHCDSNELTYLPRLPAGLVLLDCWCNELVELPDLPDGIQLLFLGKNCLKFLPKLPPKLYELYCEYNELIKLPELPSQLERLNCEGNNLVELPVLPKSLKSLFCQDNPFLTIPNEIAERFQLEKTPNYQKIMSEMKKMVKARERIKRLRFCDKLQIGIDSYIYRPEGMGYERVKMLNRGKFRDT